MVIGIALVVGGLSFGATGMSKQREYDEKCASSDGQWRRLDDPEFASHCDALFMDSGRYMMIGMALAGFGIMICIVGAAFALRGGAVSTVPGTMYPVGRSPGVPGSGGIIAELEAPYRQASAVAPPPQPGDGLEVPPPPPPPPRPPKHEHPVHLEPLGGPTPTKKREKPPTRPDDETID